MTNHQQNIGNFKITIVRLFKITSITHNGQWGCKYLVSCRAHKDNWENLQYCVIVLPNDSNDITNPPFLFQ